MLCKTGTRVTDFGSSKSGISHHDFIFCAIGISASPKRVQNFCFRNVDKVDHVALQHACRRIDWKALSSTSNADIFLAGLNKTILMLYGKFVPVISVKSRHPTVPWFSAEIKRAIEMKDFHYKIMIDNGKKFDHCSDVMIQLKAGFVGAQKTMKQLIRRAKKQTFTNAFLECRSSKETWDLIKSYGISAKKNEERIDGLSASDMNDFFCGMGGDKMNGVNVELPIEGPGFAFQDVSASDVHHAIVSIKSHAIGPDAIDPRFVKLLVKYVC